MPWALQMDNWGNAATLICPLKTPHFFFYATNKKIKTDPTELRCMALPVMLLNKLSVILRPLHWSKGLRNGK
jgi:hypothetical protein